MKALLFLEPRLLESEKQLTEKKKKKKKGEECAVFVIVIMTLTQHSVFSGVKEGMEAGKGTSPSAAAAPASAHLYSFLREKDLGSGFKNLTCKMYPVSRCAVENDHR